MAVLVVAAGAVASVTLVLVALYRVLLYAIPRLIARLLTNNGVNPPDVTAVTGGFRVTALRWKSAQLSLFIPDLRVTYPSYNSPLGLSVDGCQVLLLQQAVPKVCAAPAWSAEAVAIASHSSRQGQQTPLGLPAAHLRTEQALEQRRLQQTAAAGLSLVERPSAAQGIPMEPLVQLAAQQAAHPAHARHLAGPAQHHSAVWAGWGPWAQRQSQRQPGL
ncbi:hypothetical protein V8C86DRAFT_2470454 [Haematococcus lacustris]